MEDVETNEIPYISYRNILDNLANCENYLPELEIEIEKLELQINENLQKSNISPTRLDEVVTYLNRKNEELVQCKQKLQCFFDVCDEEKIDTHQRLSKESFDIKCQIEDLDRFRDILDSNDTLASKMKTCLQELNFVGAFECIEESNDKCEELKALSERIIPRLNTYSGLVEDLQVLMQKYEADHGCIKELLIFELTELLKQNLEVKDSVVYFRLRSAISLDQYGCFIKCILSNSSDMKAYFTHFFQSLNQHFGKSILDGNQCSVSVKDDIFELKSVKSNNSQIENLKFLIKSIIDQFTVEETIGCSNELIEFFGDIWPTEIFTMLIDHHFEGVLFKSKSDKFEDLIAKCVEVQKFMKSLGLVKEEIGSSLSEATVFSTDIYEHFSDKICKDFIVNLKKILHDDTNELTSSKSIIDGLSLEKRYPFPECKVSCWMVQIKRLLEEMATLLQTSSANFKLILTETIFSVCDLFITISPFIFKHKIERDASANAVFHNNCLLFGYLIECMVHTYKPQLDQLTELVPIVRNMATQAFLSQMKYQERVQLSFIKCDSFASALQDICCETPSTDLKDSSAAHYAFREGFNNFLHHLNKLDSDFRNVLPMKIFHRSFSTLITIFLTELIAELLAVDDISSLGSSHLSREIDYFTEELQPFIVDSDVLLHKLKKLDKINFIFKSSMLEIANLWFDGKDLLRNYLKADEVKHLIRALFQNNERRATVLSKIN